MALSDSNKKMLHCAFALAIGILVGYLIWGMKSEGYSNGYGCDCDGYGCDCDGYGCGCDGYGCGCDGYGCGCDGYGCGCDGYDCGCDGKKEGFQASIAYL